ncbi:MAG: hypothetical protein E6I62_09030 [Chloroflexi bacterium]|nr:MAG: hypothetical protein E6I62_09030 [Chloroflexota bacterium]
MTSSASSPSRLHLVLQPTFEEVYEPDFLSELPLIRFVAYERQHRVFGWVRLEADRLTDLLNGCEELHLEDVEIAGHEDGTTRSLEQFVIGRRALIAVHASGPPGDETLRQPTRLVPVALQCGQYLVGGHLHVLSGEDPLASAQQRPPMIPLTEAWIEYWTGDERRHRSTGTIIVNRDQADWMRQVTERELVAGYLRPLPSR